MLRASRSLGLLLSLGAGCGFGQSSQFSNVLAGPVFDPLGGGIRIVLGYPGAARMGPATLTGLDDAAISPDGTNAVSRVGSKIQGLRQVSSGPAQVIDFGISSTSLQAAWSPDSQTGVAWFANADGSSSFQIWPVSGTPAPPVPLSFPFASLVCVQVLPGAGGFLVAVNGASQGGIYRVDSSGNALLLAASADPAAIALDPSSPSYYFLDPQAGAVLQQSLDGSQPAQPVIVNGLAAISAPCAMAVLKGRRLAIADTASASIFIFGIDTGNFISQIQLDNVPDGFLPLSGSNWLILSHRRQPTDILLLLDSRSESVYFVPVDDK